VGPRRTALAGRLIASGYYGKRRPPLSAQVRTIGSRAAGLERGSA
jgi:hypothetical protein